MRILVVEDDPMLPNSLKLGLGQQILLADMDFHSFIYHLSGNPLIAGRAVSSPDCARGVRSTAVTARLLGHCVNCRNRLATIVGCPSSPRPLTKETRLPMSGGSPSSFGTEALAAIGGKPGTPVQSNMTSFEQQAGLRAT